MMAKSDASDFVEKTISLLKAPALSEELGRNARRVAEEKHDWRVIAEKFEEFILHLAKLKNIRFNGAPAGSSVDNRAVKE